MKFNLEVPCNVSGYGQVGWGILYEIYSRGLEPNIFTIGEDLRPFVKDPAFEIWLSDCKNKSLKDFRNLPTLRLWHISGSERLLSKRNILWTANECSELTSEEFEILSGYDKIIVTSNYSKDVFAKYFDPDSKLFVVHNFFDSIHYKNTTVKKPKQLNWGLFGKMEKRKQSRSSLISWANKFGNNPNHHLTCAIFNGFLDAGQQANEINSWFNGRPPYNISFLGPQPTNEEMNTIYNSVDIVIALNSAEGTNLPLLTCLGLGKHALVHNATGHRDFCNFDNSVLIESSGQEPIYDNIFFIQGSQFNQGVMPSISYKSVVDGYDQVLKRFNENPVNESGFKIKDDFSVSKTVDALLSHL